MSYKTVPSVADNDTWSASQHNTYIRDNFSALWPYTTAGDMAYSDSTSSLARLPIGSNGQVLSILNYEIGWYDFYSPVSCLVGIVTPQSIPNASWTTLSFDTIYKNSDMFSLSSPTEINIIKDGIYNVSGFVRYSNNDTGTREFKIYFSGAVNPDYVDTIEAGNESVNTFSIPIKAVSGDTLDFWCYQGSGTALTVTANIFVSYWGS